MKIKTRISLVIACLIAQQIQAMPKKKKNKPIIQHLINAGSQQKEKYNKLLLEAAKSGNIEKIILALDNGANIETTDENNSTPLHWALCHKDSSAAKLLIKMGANIKSTNKMAFTPLHYAVSYGHAEIVKILLAAKADKEAKGQSRVTPLFCAIEKEHTEIVKILLEAGANKENKIKLQVTPLHYAVSRGHTEIVKILLAYKADINAKNRDQLTPLHLATIQDYTEVVNILLAANNEYKDAKSPLAVFFNQPKVTALLLEYKAEIPESLRSSLFKILGFENKECDLIKNLILGKPEITQKLFQLKLKPETINFQDKAGMSTLMYAAAYNNKDIVKALLNYGKEKGVIVDALAQNSIGETALSIASTHNNSKVAHLIKAYLKAFKQQIIDELYGIDEDVAKIIVSYLTGEYLHTCANCKEKNAKKKCCKNFYYCSKECQKTNWPKHKAHCLHNKKESPSENIEEVD